MSLLLVVVVINYVAQIPYYIHQYYAPHGFLPSLYGSVLLAMTLVWFSVAFYLLHRRSAVGYVLMIAFLVVEFLFYLQTQISQALTSHQILLHVYRPDNPLLFIVFAIGYINFAAAAYFIVYLLRNHDSFLANHARSR